MSLSNPNHQCDRKDDPIHQQDCPLVAPPLADLLLKTIIERDLAALRELDNSAIEVRVHHGTVHLIGEVDDHRHITSATRVVFRIPAVKAVACRLAVRGQQRSLAVANA